MIPHVTVTAADVAQARREWEEMDPAYTSYTMRHRAEMRYMSLKRLYERQPGPVAVLGTPPRTAERWRALAERARGGR